MYVSRRVVGNIGDSHIGRTNRISRSIKSCKSSLIDPHSTVVHIAIHHPPGALDLMKGSVRRNVPCKSCWSGPSYGKFHFGWLVTAILNQSIEPAITEHFSGSKHSWA